MSQTRARKLRDAAVVLIEEAARIEESARPEEPAKHTGTPRCDTCGRWGNGNDKPGDICFRPNCDGRLYLDDRQRFTRRAIDEAAKHAALIDAFSLPDDDEEDLVAVRTAWGTLQVAPSESPR